MALESCLKLRSQFCCSIRSQVCFVVNARVTQVLIHVGDFRKSVMTWPWAGHRCLEHLLPQLLGLGLARQVKQSMVEIWGPKRLVIGGLLSVVQSICCSILLFNPKPTLNHGECPSHTSSVSCGWFLEIRLAHPALAQSQPPRPRRLSATTAWTWTGEAGETGVGWNLRA